MTRIDSLESATEQAQASAKDVASANHGSKITFLVLKRDDFDGATEYAITGDRDDAKRARKSGWKVIGKAQHEIRIRASYRDLTVKLPKAVKVARAHREVR